MKTRRTGITIFRLASAIALAIGLTIIVACALAALPPTHRALSLSAAPAAGGVITVTTTLDEYNTSPNSTCSLREAVESINTGTSFGGCTNPGGADTAMLMTGTYALTIPKGALDNWNEYGALYVNTTTVTIRGMGPSQTVVEGGPSLNDRVLYAGIDFYPSASSLTLEGMTVRNGSASSGHGGGVYVDYGWPTTFTLESVILEGNDAGTGDGGGVYLHGSQPATTVISDVVVRNNQAASGGGLYIRVLESESSGAFTYLTDVLIASNTAITGAGGGLYLDNHAEIRNVTIANNRAKTSGGGLYCDGEYSADIVRLSNVTIFSNTAENSGGGVYLDHGSGGMIASTNATIAGNWVSNTTGGNIYVNAGGMSVGNTIVAGGSPDNCAGNPSPNITTRDYNLDTDNTCTLTDTHDIHPSVAGLASTLADRGGRTPTLALLPNSQAIDAGTCSGAPPLDQRGISRPQGPLSQCDIGAFEFDQWERIYLPLVVRNY
jgi:CSLREA domain-containing protein